jgi:hypothetical protein
MSRGLRFHRREKFGWLLKGGREALAYGGEPKDGSHMDFITHTRSKTQMFNISYGK